MHPTGTYLHDAQTITASGEGVPETSYYPALSTLRDRFGIDLPF